MGKCTVDNRDDYYRRAKEDGYRARSAYKLLDLDRQFDLLNPQKVRRVCDLCAAPGSWSQVLADRLISQAHAPNQQRPPAYIVSVDLQRVAPIPGVFVIQGDITSTSTINEILQRFDGVKADLVLCDGAGELSACVIDEYLQAKLVLTALGIAQKIMQHGATFVCKVLVGDSYRDLVERKLSVLFERVETVKPPSSRASSSEHFAVCIGMLSDDDASSGKKLADMMLSQQFTNAETPPLKPVITDAVNFKSGSTIEGDEVQKLNACSSPSNQSTTLNPISDIVHSAATNKNSQPPTNNLANKELFRQFYSSYAASKLPVLWNPRLQ